MPSQDELLQIAAQKSAQQAIAEINDEYQRSYADCAQAIQRGDEAMAAWHMRQIAQLSNEARTLAAATQPQQQEQQPQQDFTEMEAEWIRRNPSITNDPRKFREVLSAANSLVARGYDRNSAAYISAIDLAAGNGQDSVDAELTPNLAAEISGIDADEYNRGVQQLIDRKKMGFYKND